MLQTLHFLSTVAVTNIYLAYLNLSIKCANTGIKPGICYDLILNFSSKFVSILRKPFSTVLFNYTVQECTNKNIIDILSKRVYVRLQGVPRSRATQGKLTPQVLTVRTDQGQSSCNRND